MRAVTSTASESCCIASRSGDSLSTALGWRDMVGRGSGEAFQLELSGNGSVYVQASEEKL